MTGNFFMEAALRLAERAFSLDEIPVGAVVVYHGEIISEGFNRNRELNDPTMHAEIIAIRGACEKLANERLNGCDIYVTKEPCAMCAGAIVHARIDRVIIGAEDIKAGACGTVLNICGNRALNHRPEIVFGVKKDESAALLKKFFQQKRAAAKNGG
ncbi:MAG TPA: tRNA adenosine(34) deaminase TadA [Spirochaetota bacterium]|nr:tRNA adenosine(34) deaminase TadA [Spirochaetota bacterium]HPF05157.1 tRNA adenosine(34) deaminase TadA [Spirochaetota bacterium]HPJ42579.1 tRNA adenosine(34) deaminase TadA [Spirochaetota bacterium]HPR36258.1 tRNA adenosine(34) deaminase TadA [Spirochaetota bacterium]HRX47243.1 tRNA adenosine(34) deaminase TadA [Spirochaetota bacterium]